MDHDSGASPKRWHALKPSQLRHPARDPIMNQRPGLLDTLLERGWWLPLAVALSWLAFAWTAAIAIDIHDVGGMQDRMLEWSPLFPLAW